MIARLTESQVAVLRKLAKPNQDGWCRVYGRGEVGSARVLGRLGLAVQVSSHRFYCGEAWNITDAGKAVLAEIEGKVRP